MKEPKTHVAYLTRKMPVQLRDRLHGLVEMKRRQGYYYTVEDIVNVALELGVTLMEFGTEKTKGKGRE